MFFCYVLNCFHSRNLLYSKLSLELSVFSPPFRRVPPTSSPYLRILPWNRRCKHRLVLLSQKTFSCREPYLFFTSVRLRLVYCSETVMWFLKPRWYMSVLNSVQVGAHCRLFHKFITLSYYIFFRFDYGNSLSTSLQDFTDL